MAGSRGRSITRLHLATLDETSGVPTPYFIVMAGLVPVIRGGSSIRPFSATDGQDSLAMTENRARFRFRQSRQIHPRVNLAKIASARLNALSTATAGVIPFLITSACALPQSCSALTCPQAGL